MKVDFIPNSEMGNLIRAKDWSRTPLGPMNTWPQSLLTTLNIILHSKFPMFLWWGPELICFYNDAYRPSLGNEGKHPHILGMRAEEAWREIWTIIKPLIDQVLSGGGATWSEDQLIPIFRNGKIEDVYWTFSYSPVMDEAGGIRGVLVTCNETTQAVQTRQSLELALEVTGLSTWSLDLHTYQITHSPRLAVIFGHPETKRLTYAQLEEQVYPEDLEHIVKPALEMALTTGEYQYESRIVLPDASIRWIRIRGTVVFDSSQTPQQMFGTLMDITDLHLGSEHSARLAAIVESSDDAIISKRLDGTITSWNSSAQRVFGYAPEEIIGQSVMRLIPPDRQHEETSIISRLMKGERVDHIETKRLNKYGELIDLSLTISPILDPAGKIIGASKIARDITRQKKVEREILENEQRLQMVIEASALGTWELDLKTRAVLYSKRYLEILGFKEGQNPTHAELLQRIHPDDLPVREEAFRKALKTGRLQYSARLIMPDNSIRWMEGRGYAYFDEQGEAIKMTGTVRDITEEKVFSQTLENMVEIRTRELRQANVELEKMNQELASFAYVSSHDLQEPLRKIQAFASRVLESEYAGLTDAGKDYFGRMQGAARRMQLLIQDLLAYSRTNRKEKDFVQTDLNILVSGVLEDLDPSIQECHASVTVGVLPELPVIPFQFRQLFTNLISNSLKFRRENVPLEIHIQSDKVKGDSIALERINPDVDYYRIEIRDTGIGFDNAYGERIFEVFQRLHTRQEYEGTGIGLAICKKIVENHHGFITAWGDPGHGATFTIYLPAGYQNG